MAPDLNSVPPSPRPRPAPSTSSPAAPPSVSNSPAASRRVSQVMGPPPIPFSSPSSTATATATSPGMGDHSSVGLGPGPLRHPRPMTPAELHLELEKEQEAVVNRLTRELSLLRQQTASVASTTSSTSTGLNDAIDPLHSSPYLSGSIHPTSSRRHRSSSNLSAYVPAAPGPRTGSVASIAPSRESGLPPSRPSADYPRVSRSRDPSVTSVRQPGTASPSRSSSFPLPGDPPHSTTATARYEEAAYHRAELESIKRENELLRRRVRELEQTLKTYREAPPTGGSNHSTDSAPVPGPSNLINPMRDASIGGTR
ncbi:hypothetical protein Egran_03019 [Elaphomyces granulatus]|uniref:Uncharacterized protein n=1 Tax=Elaphomyces granulatus TaxID=519963 RepID=A0A232LYV5_9EURO|nr:hypothetical protein Egran_03019 [Elaphomyces granulatus]